MVPPQGASSSSGLPTGPGLFANSPSQGPFAGSSGMQSLAGSPLTLLEQARQAQRLNKALDGIMSPNRQPGMTCHISVFPWAQSMAKVTQQRLHWQPQPASCTCTDLHGPPWGSSGTTRGSCGTNLGSCDIILGSCGTTLGSCDIILGSFPPWETVVAIWEAVPRCWHISKGCVQELGAEMV